MSRRFNKNAGVSRWNLSSSAGGISGRGPLGSCRCPAVRRLTGGGAMAYDPGRGVVNGLANDI
ncbi:unannotated protein [freshwater metagenome]|uniref:Unannotated protein n=1 Tax=freshwater metagenome TaxID=449393 RepID=A0A6J7APA6_9ZZZZ